MLCIEADITLHFASLHMIQCIDFQSFLCSDIDPRTFNTSSSTSLRATLELRYNTVTGGTHQTTHTSGYFNIMKVKKENGEAESTQEQKESKREHLNVKVYFFVLFQFVLMYHMIGSLYDCQLAS